MSSDPKRLIVSEENELGVALAVARRQMPGDDRLAMLAAGLAAKGVALPASVVHPEVASAQSPKDPGFRLGLELKVGIGIALLGGAGLLAALRGSSDSHPSHAAQLAQREPARVAMLSSSLPEPALAAPAPPPVTDVARSRVQAPGSAAVAEPAIEQPTGEQPAAQPVPEKTVAPVAEPAHLAVAAPNTSRSASKTKAATDSTVYVTPSGEEQPVTELDLVKQARNAVSADPMQAYALTERSRAKFPQAVFGQERDFIAVTALFRMGREREARSQATAFRSHYPRSAYLPQIDRMLGER